MNIGNQKLQKKINRERIINLLRQKGNMSRSQIAEYTKLGWGSITKYTGELLQEEIIKEVGAQKSKGRNSVILGLNEDHKYLVGLDIGSSFIKGIVVNMTGVECAFLREETLWESDRETVLEQIYSHIEKLLAQAGISENQLLAIGCGLAGGIDFEHSVVKDAANFRDFDGVPLGRLIRERFNTPCFLANSIIVRLLGESVSNAVINEKNIAYVSLGTGIGAGIIFQSKILVPTENEKIGDIAHFMVEKDGAKCNCGLHGCLEALVGARRLMAKIKTQLPESNSILKDGMENLDWEAIAHAAESNDELVCGILKEAGRYIGMALCGVIQFHRPEIIVLGGGMTNLGDCLINAIKDEIADSLPKERFDVDNIVISDQIYRCGAIGATMYAWDNIFHSEREYVNLKLQGTMDN
jgi:predicted NBD/HSP70 family sugar kinase